MKQFLNLPPLTALLILLLVPLTVHSQSRKTDNVLRLDDPENRPVASISQMAWLTGAWVGEGLGGHVEETWNAPSGGTMLGSFKLVHGDQPSIYELELIIEEQKSLAWRVKHFNPDFSAWEDKAEYVSFPLVKIEDEAAYFDGLTVRKEGEDGLKIFVTMNHEGTISEESFTLQRVR